MIKKEEVKRIAFLGRIKLTDGEVLKFKKELNEILEYVDGLKEATLNKEINISSRIKNIFRRDEVSEEENQELGDLIQKNINDSQLKVMNVFKKEK
jgi:aspartyl/glutamyl-tRNA(Asn/Gln) amidotransferase C subunit